SDSARGTPHDREGSVFRGTCDAPGDDGAGGGYAHVTGSAPVYRHDTIETGADGAVGITFTDGPAFNLSNNTRMALNEFVYDGTSNSPLFTRREGGSRGGAQDRHPLAKAPGGRQSRRNGYPGAGRTSVLHHTRNPGYEPI